MLKSTLERACASGRPRFKGLGGRSWLAYESTTRERLLGRGEKGGWEGDRPLSLRGTHVVSLVQVGPRARQRLQRIDVAILGGDEGWGGTVLWEKTGTHMSGWTGLEKGCGTRCKGSL